MKRILTIILLLAMAITGPFVVPMFAGEHAAVADIPFAFVINQQTMPAGTYRVEQLSSGIPVFQFSNAHKQSVLGQFGVNVTGNPGHPSLTFACYGKECVLAKVTPPGTANAYSLGSKALERSVHHKVGVASMISIKLAK